MTVQPPDTDWLAHVAAANPHSLALVTDDGAEISYGELNALADKTVARLQANSVTTGDIIPIAVGGADLSLISLLWGVWRIGAAPVVIDQNSPLRAQWETDLGRIWDVEHDSTPDALLHTVVLTSGSGGDPRPVRLTHSNVAAAVAASEQRIGNTAADRWLMTLPLFHVGGLSILWRSAAAGGAVVLHEKFDPQRTSAAMKDGSVSMVSLVPTMLYRILAANPGPYAGLGAVLMGGAVASRDLVEQGLDAGLPILQTYGMTEAGSQIATVAPGEAFESLGTAGRPLAAMEVSTGEAGVGEIVISGPAVSPGYLGEPDRDGSYRTGDIGYLDDKGRLVVLGRADDMVVTGGENVFPARVADVLSAYQSFDRVEVVGVPDPEWGQVLVAVVVGDIDSQPRIERWAQERLARHEIPKHWAFVDAIPLLAGGKVDRVALFDIAMKAP
ncbi:MAG: 2-succinylbenzoate--CoA ligase [bacterium]|nr:2-succinylbenzoate--CoA ligase [bacterium]